MNKQHKCTCCGQNMKHPFYVDIEIWTSTGMDEDEVYLELCGACYELFRQKLYEIKHFKHNP